ncbi:MAG TPA: DUF192 domain-containing protein [Patescibacteria group bacterium]|nr:DUF192 domain-containing protein [Patescibacteria group bacterium]
MATKDIKVKDTVIKVEIAETTAEQVKGLAGRAEICETCGMLFEYSDYQIRNFWMKGMQFPLDVIWILNDEIVGIEKNVQILDSADETSRIKSPKVVNRVLEVPAGLADQYGLEAGDKIEGLD